MAHTLSPPRSTMSHIPIYQPGPAELLEAGTIRARSTTRRHGITSPETLAVVVRFGQMIDEARKTTSAETTHPDKDSHHD